MIAWGCGALALLLAVVVAVPLLPARTASGSLAVMVARLVVAGDRSRARKLLAVTPANLVARALGAALDATEAELADVEARQAAARTAYDERFRADLAAAVRRWWLATLALAVAGYGLWALVEAGAWNPGGYLSVAAVIVVVLTYRAQRRLGPLAVTAREQVVAALAQEVRGAVDAPAPGATGRSPRP